jgi:hypothetical protein
MATHDLAASNRTGLGARHTLQIALVVILGLAMLSRAWPARTQAASTAASTQVDVFHASQRFTQALFEHTDPSGCTLTLALVQAGTIVRHDVPGGPTQSPLVSVLIQQGNRCTGGSAINAFGSTAVFDRLAIAPDLQSATVAATINVLDATTETTFAVHLDVAWTATGLPITTVSNTTTTMPGVVMVRHMNGAMRAAQASGTVTTDIGANTINFTPDPSASAEIDRLVDSQIIVQRG